MIESTIFWVLSILMGIIYLYLGKQNTSNIFICVVCPSNCGVWLIKFEFLDIKSFEGEIWISCYKTIWRRKCI